MHFHHARRDAICCCLMKTDRMDVMVVWKRRGATLVGRGKAARCRLGWPLSAFIVAVALLGPPLTSQSVPAFVAIRHNVLMLDRELETASGWSEGTMLLSSGVTGAATPGRWTI